MSMEAIVPNGSKGLVGARFVEQPPPGDAANGYVKDLTNFCVSMREKVVLALVGVT